MEENTMKILQGHSTNTEISARKRLLRLMAECPIPENERLFNFELFLNRQSLQRIFFMDFLYKKILNVNGVIMEFGVRWGRNLALFESLRGIYEPFNYHRKIIGFDTFSGFPSIHKKDGDADIVSSGGSYSVTANYDSYLEQILDYHEQESPISHIKKYALIKGDATVEIDTYLKNNPETIIAFAYFDFDIYEPTKKCLEAIKSHITKGSIIGFDELNHHEFPGETLALKEAFGLDKYKIQRTSFSGRASYIIIE